MSWRTITIFIEEGHDLVIDLHGQFAPWELESILMRTMEKVQDKEVNADTEEVASRDEDGTEASD